MLEKNNILIKLIRATQLWDRYIMFTLKLGIMYPIRQSAFHFSASGVLTDDKIGMCVVNYFMGKRLMAAANMIYCSHQLY